MGRRDEAAPDRQRRALDAVDAQVLEREGDAAHLADGVDGADLVEVHLLGIHVVDAGLGVGEPAEGLLRPLARPLGQARGVDQRADRAPVALRLAGRGSDRGVRGADRVPADALRAQLEPLDGEPGQPVADHVRIGAGVEQRAQQHVAGDAGHAVEVEDAGHRPPPAERAIRAAIVPAPKPSSMFTTATPAAHEMSIECSAVMPDSAAP